MYCLLYYCTEFGNEYAVILAVNTNQQKIYKILLRHTITQPLITEDVMTQLIHNYRSIF